MRRLALISICGGVGRTTLAALLATLYARQGAWSLLLEWDPRHVAGWTLGAQRPAEGGVARAVLDGQDWSSTCLQADDGTLLLPYGRLTPEEEGRFAARMAEQPSWLAQQLERLDAPNDAHIVIDTPAGPSVYQRQAVHAADAVLLLVRADMQALVLLEQALALAGDRPVAVVINQLDIGRPSQNDALRRLRAALGHRLVPYPVHRDEAVAQAAALNRALPDHAPQSQAMHDVHGLLAWLQRWQTIRT